MTLTLIIGTELGLFIKTRAGAEWNTPRTTLYGKRIVAVAITPTAPRIIFAAVAGEGIFRSHNMGQSWRIVFADSPTCLSMVSSLWAGTASCGLFHSPDGGETWRDASATLLACDGAEAWYPPRFFDTPFISTLAESTLSKTLMAGIKIGGAVRSDNGGDNWVFAGDELDTTVHRICAHPNTPSTWLANTDEGIFFSENNGGNWEEMMTGIDLFFGIDVIFSAAGTCIAAASSTPPGNWVENSWTSLYRTNKLGGQWQTVSLPRAEYITTFAAVPGSKTAIALGTQSGALYISADDGHSWQSAGQVNGAVAALQAFQGE